LAIDYDAIYLDASRCVGCTTCTQRCPTEAIRVRDGKAVIMRDRCVVCGECIRVCPHNAMKARVDALDDLLYKKKYLIALPAPSLYGQFPGNYSRQDILSALLKIGFDDTFEVTAAAEAVSALLHHILQTDEMPRPVITTACPVVLRIVRNRFPSLMPHLFNYRSPMDVASRWSLRLAARKTGLPPEDIGCVFISPCPAKCSSAKAPLDGSECVMDGIVSIAEVAARMIPVLERGGKRRATLQARIKSAGLAVNGGQATTAAISNHLSVCGMENIIRILEALEDGKLNDVDLIELNACTPGCVGGALTAENPYIAQTRIEQLRRQPEPVLPVGECPLDDMKWESMPEPNPVMQLDSDLSAALEKMERIQEIQKTLRGIDCGACGSPSCRAFAEDIVAGRASTDMCVFARKKAEETNG